MVRNNKTASAMRIFGGVLIIGSIILAVLNFRAISGPINYAYVIGTLVGGISIALILLGIAEIIDILENK